MKSITVSIPKDMKKELDNFPDINIAQYLKMKFEEKLKQIK